MGVSVGVLMSAHQYVEDLCPVPISILCQNLKQAVQGVLQELHKEGNGPSTNHQPHVYSMTCCGSEDYERTAIAIDPVISMMHAYISSRQGDMVIIGN